MNRESVQIKIFHVSNNESVEATLFEGLSKQNIQDHEEKWIPLLEQANQKATKYGHKRIAEDAHWRWSEKVDYRSGQIAYRHYAIEYEGYTVGLMMINLVAKKSKIEPNKDLVYLEYISVCPEARKEIKNPPDFQGIGSVLFHVAIEVSFEEGIEGKIGLHSLPGASAWYSKKMGMKNLGIDQSESNLEYFELTKEKALELKQQREKMEVSHD